jgi:hypothetical protein
MIMMMERTAAGDEHQKAQARHHPLHVLTLTPSLPPLLSPPPPQQPAKKKARRLKRKAKAAAFAPRPTQQLRPVVHAPTQRVRLL